MKTFAIMLAIGGLALSGGAALADSDASAGNTFGSVARAAAQNGAPGAADELKEQLPQENGGDNQLDQKIQDTLGDISSEGAVKGHGRDNAPGHN